MTKATKAERIFEATRQDCRRHLKSWPGDGSIGFNAVSTETELVSQRTINDMRKVLDRKLKEIEISKKLNISTPEKLDFDEAVLRMVEVTINNEERKVQESKIAYLAE